jgi:hypothetical protein
VLIFTTALMFNTTLSGSRHDRVHRICLGVLYFKNVAVSGYSRKCNRIYVHKQITTFSTADMQETRKCLAALCSGLLYQISAKPGNKCG